LAIENPRRHASQPCTPAIKSSNGVLSPRLEIKRLVAFICDEPFLFGQQGLRRLLGLFRGFNGCFSFTILDDPLR
jgi:hypothetical protein